MTDRPNVPRTSTVAPDAASAADYSLEVTLPLPPGVNNMYLSLNGRRVLSPEGRRYKEQVRKRLDELSFSGNLSEEAIDAFRAGYLSLFIDFYFATPMRRDLDGGLKIAQDAVCEALGVNDNRVVDIHLVKRVDPLRPRIEVQLETISGGEWNFCDEYVYVGREQEDETAG
jgi:crossover junction endodeoxyribonuclease RusA